MPLSGRRSTIISAHRLRFVWIEQADVGQIAKTLFVVHAVAHNKVVGMVKAT